MLRVGLWGEALCAPPNGTRTLIASLVHDLIEAGGYEVTIICPALADVARLAQEFDSPRAHFLRASSGVWANRLGWLAGLDSLTSLAGSQHVWLSGWHWPLGSRDLPFVAIVHDLRLLEAEQNGNAGSLRRTAWRLLTFASLKLGLRRAAAIVCVSEFTRRRLLEWFPAAEGRIDVIHNGIDVDYWARRPSADAQDAVRRLLGLPEASNYVLGLGAHSPQKNFPALIRAFARLADGPDAPRLIIAGREAGDTERIKAAADAAGLSGRVILASGLADDEIRTLMHGARIFAFPSLYEGFGIPLLEAFAAGTPVVASAIAPIDDIADGAAMLVDPSDVGAIAEALHSVWNDPERRSTLARAGRQRVVSFHQARTTSRYRQLIDHVAAAAAAPQVSDSRLSAFNRSTASLTRWL